MNRQERETLENIFEKAYQDYVAYEKYIKAESKNVAKGREEFAKFALANKDKTDLILERMYEVNEKPVLLGIDSTNIKTRLVNLYDALKDLIEIPKEVKEEINAFPRIKYFYKIEDGEAIPINPEMHNDVRNRAKNTNMRFISEVIQAGS